MALNKKTTIGTYSIKDTSETIDSVGGVDKTSTVASLKTNTENSQTIKNGLTIVFTLSDDAGLTPVDGKTKWDTKTVEKTYDATLEVASTSMIYSIYGFSNYLPVVINLVMFVIFLKFDLEEKLPKMREEIAARRAGKTIEK